MVCIAVNADEPAVAPLSGAAAMSAFLIFDGLIKKHADSKGTYER
jgi:hypothetical protein